MWQVKKDVCSTATVKVKPITVNRAWAGRRFKTPEYKAWRTEMLYSLPTIDIPDGKIAVDMIFGLSSSNADIDNPIKPTLDSFLDRYGINDKDIFELNVKKQHVKKGDEFITFTLRDYIPE